MRNQVRPAIFLSLILLNSSFAWCQDNKELARQHYQKGNTYFQEGRYREAQEEFQKALKILHGEESGIAVSLPEPQAAALPQTLSKTPPLTKEKTAQEEILPPGKPEAAKPAAYLIGEEDALRITVWQNPDLDQDVIVRPDGKISFPLIGDVQAVGLPIPQLDDEITRRLQEFIKYPQVSVFITKMGGRKVMVLGEVSSPGVYALTGNFTLLQAIARAGGFTPSAVISSVIVIKGGFLNPKGIRLNLNPSLLRGDAAGNTILESEDIVYVPKKFIANINYFVGQILGPISSGSTSVYTTVPGLKKQ